MTEYNTQHLCMHFLDNTIQIFFFTHKMWLWVSITFEFLICLLSIMHRMYIYWYQSETCISLKPTSYNYTSCLRSDFIEILYFQKIKYKGAFKKG